VTSFATSVTYPPPYQPNSRAEIGTGSSYELAVISPACLPRTAVNESTESIQQWHSSAILSLKLGVAASGFVDVHYRKQLRSATLGRGPIRSRTA
jgi:hypothetical protein